MPESDVHSRSTSAPCTDENLVSCVQAAIAAPSIHNSQPWRFRIHHGGIDVFADWDRRLDVVDPSGRELLISIGAALFNLRLSMRHQGWMPTTRVFLTPDGPDRPDLIARITAGRPAPPTAPLNILFAAIPRRHTNRLPFAPTTIPAAVLDELVAAAAMEGATVRVASAVGRNAILSLVRTAERRLADRGIYRAELTDWTRPAHHRRDGIPPQAFGPWDAMEALPLRDFGLTQPQLRRAVARYEPYPTIVVLSTEGDHAPQWLTSGQALQRMLLVATAQGLAATPMSQPLEIAALRELVTDTDHGLWAQLILRLGYATPVGPTPRRPLADVLSGQSNPVPDPETESRSSEVRL